jgi:trk system potassium uptake protein TrkH
MHFSAIAYVMGVLLLVTGGSMILPVICSIYYGEDDLFALLVSMFVIILLGLPFFHRYKNSQDLGIKDALIIAPLGWMIVSALSALPFMIHGSIPSFTDGFFEMMSGYTTSGATILTDIEVVPHGLLFWRSETHLLGGMGFLTLVVIFLPHGMGGLRIFRAESSPGQVITKEKFLPRNRDTMVWLWGIYVGLNLLETIMLAAGGMSIFDSLCHAFGTVSTSGYSPKNLSIGHYDNAYFDWVIILFMFLGGMTFMLFFRMMQGNWRSVFLNTEFRWYCGFLVFSAG